MTNISGYSTSDPKIVGNYTLLFSIPVTAILGLLSSIVSLTTVAGNLLVITSFFVERALRNATNYFIASLAVTDLLIGVFSMNFYTLYLLLNHWPLGELFCDLWLSLDYTACLTSQYTVFLITVDRFCSVHIPAKYRNWRTDKKVRVMVGMTWLLPSSIFFTCILGWPVFTGGRGRDYDQCWAGFTNNVIFNTILTIAYYWVTLIVMIGLYVCIYHVALNLQRKSDAKRKKMASLVSMTGQTMSRIGVGIVNETNEEYLLNSRQSNTIELTECRNDKSAVAKKCKKNKVSQKEKKKTTKSEERSSSPSFPSDSDNASSSQPNCCNKSNTDQIATSQFISENLKIESPIIRDDSPTPSETSPFSFFQFGKAQTTALNSRFNRKNRQKCEGPMSAYSNDSDYQTASGISTDLMSEFQQINSMRYNSDLGIHRSNGLITHSETNPIGIQFIDSNSFCNSKTKITVKLSQKENTFFPSTENNSPVWIRRFEFSDDNENHISENEDFNERDPTATDTVVICNSVKTEVVKASCITFSEPSTRWYRHNSTSTHNRRPSISFRKIIRIQFSRFINAIRRVFSVLLQRIRAKATREPKQIFERGRTENRARKALRTITIILGAFVICWTPYHVLILVKCYLPDLVNNHLFNLSYWLCYANSPINPFCYALANAQFKKAFLRLLKGDFRRT